MSNDSPPPDRAASQATGPLRHFLLKHDAMFDVEAGVGGEKGMGRHLIDTICWNWFSTKNEALGIETKFKYLKNENKETAPLSEDISRKVLPFT